MHPAKHNSTMDKGTGLIFSLFDVTSSRDARFRQPQYVQYMHHGLAFVFLCVPVLFADNTRSQFVVMHLPSGCVGYCAYCPYFYSDWIDCGDASRMFFVCNAV